MNEIIKNDWYESLVEDCRAIITETGFSSQWALIKGYKELGDRILEDSDKESITKLVKRVSVSLGKSQRIIWKSVQFAKKYPDIRKLPEGKKITLRYIFNKLLPEEKEFPEKDSWLRIYDVWNFSKIDNRFGMDYPGRTPYELIANVLHYFTKEGELVIDPMAGGGTTIDVCRMLKRNCIAFDKEPIREDIKRHNLDDGWPQETKKASLIFWDPPYFNKKDYGEKSVSKLKREDYLERFESWIKTMPKTKVAFLMSNYIDYNNPEESIFTADYYFMFKKAGFRCLYEIQCPLSTQQYQAFQVSRAKEEGKILIISRSLYIYG